MNEKIEKLAEQFRMDFSIDENSQDGIHWDNVDEFAQLIIKECAQVCNNIDVEYEGEDVLATWCASAIKEHFGVE